jgi:hypothetical protein
MIIRNKIDPAQKYSKKPDFQIRKRKNKVYAGENDPKNVGSQLRKMKKWGFHEGIAT